MLAVEGTRHRTLRCTRTKHEKHLLPKPMPRRPVSEPLREPRARGTPYHTRTEPACASPSQSKPSYPMNSDSSPVEGLPDRQTNSGDLEMIRDPQGSRSWMIITMTGLPRLPTGEHRLNMARTRATTHRERERLGSVWSRRNTAVSVIATWTASAAQNCAYPDRVDDVINFGCFWILQHRGQPKNMLILLLSRISGRCL